MNRMLSGRKNSQKKVKWAVAPVIHAIDANSPSVRRMDLKHAMIPLDTIDESTLRVEMTERGLDPGKDENYASLLKAFNDELREELRSDWGLFLCGENKRLAEMVDLSRILGRRVYLRQNKSPDSPMPADMSQRELTSELIKRNIEIKGMGIQSMAVGLEEAMLKEIDGFIGGGYEFGQRFISVDDYLQSEEFANMDMNQFIKSRGLKSPRRKKDKETLLTKLIEKDLNEGLHKSFREEVIDEIKRRNISIIFEEGDRLHENDFLHASRINGEKLGVFVEEADTKASIVAPSPSNPVKRLRFDDLASPKQKVMRVEERLSFGEICLENTADLSDEDFHRFSTEELFTSLYEDGSWKAYRPTKPDSSAGSSSSEKCVLF